MGQLEEGWMGGSILKDSTRTMVLKDCQAMDQLQWQYSDEHKGPSTSTTRGPVSETSSWQGASSQ
eukprot:11194801-Prorocentrum_lima.AAC.1